MFTRTNGLKCIYRSFIEGYFYFDAKGIGDDTDVKYNITDGKFLIKLNGPSYWFVPYKD